MMKIHNDKVLYQLLPRRAKNNASYAVMQGVCSSAGSPFNMEHRVDPLDYKLVLRAQEFEIRNQYNAKSSEKVPQTIWFDGILSAPEHSGLVYHFNSVSAAHVNQMVGAHLFLKEWVQLPTDGDRHRQLRELYAALLKKKTHLFLGCTGVPGRDVLNLAKSKGVFVYAKKGMRYFYSQ
jgi:hypothetical protein